MSKEDVLDVLLDHKEALRARGVMHAGLFGSVAGGEENADSDVDIVIKLASDT
jgi:uncharacterized protein